MKNPIRFFFVLFLLSSLARAIDGYYVGAQLGHVSGFEGSSAVSYNSAIGIGLDLGLRTNPVLDVVLQLQRSSHGGGATLYSQFISADFHFFEFNDIDFTLGAGPGFYFFATSAKTDTNFGIHLGPNVDVMVDERVKIGVGGRWHSVFSGNSGGAYWSVMARLGYLFPAGN